MEPRKFIAHNMNSAMKMVKAAFGDDAVIISSQNINNQVEILALPDMPEPVKDKINIRLDDEADLSHFDNIILSKTPHAKQDDYLKNELAAIKELLKAKPYQEKSLHPVVRQLADKLKLLGYGKDLVQYLLMDVDVSATFEYAWEQIVRKMVGDILIDNVNLSKKKIKAIIGPSGAGKTLYMSRLVHYNQLLMSKEKFGFIFVNHSNIKTIEEANVFSRLFEVPALHVESISDLLKSMKYLSAYDHIFIEFPAYDFNCEVNNFYMKFIQDYQDELDITLVMSANAQYAFIEKYINLFKNVFINGMVATKLDELAYLEGVIQANLKYRIPLRYFTSGAHMLDHINCAEKDYFYRYLAVSELEATRICQAQL